MSLREGEVGCPLCHASTWRQRYPATSRPHEGSTTTSLLCTSHELACHDDIVQCTSCGMLFCLPLPDADELVERYRAVVDPTYERERGGRERTFATSLEQLHRFRRPPGRVLDVGCYTGVFLQVATQAGWQTAGVELSTWAAEIARRRGVGEVFSSPLQELGLPAASYDVITLWDVIEHLPDPLVLINEVARLLTPGGVVALTTHLADSPAARIMGTRYPFFMAMHPIHFTRATMRRMLAAHGFDLLAITPHRRILRVGYVLSKLRHRLGSAPVRALLRFFEQRSWVSQRYLSIRGVGLANIFAKKR